VESRVFFVLAADNTYVFVLRQIVIIAIHFRSAIRLECELDRQGFVCLRDYFSKTPLDVPLGLFVVCVAKQRSIGGEHSCIFVDCLFASVFLLDDFSASLFVLLLVELRFL